MRILTGRAGSGKTTAILSEIAAQCEKNEGRQILLVPELGSHRCEWRLAEATHNRAARQAEVLTFSRLADRVFSEVGGLAQPMLTDAGRLLTLQEAARRTESGLSMYAGISDKPELLREALRAIDECKTCRTPPEQLLDAAQQVEDATLAQKLTDLAQLYTAYDRLCEQSLSDPRDRLQQLAEGLSQSTVLENATVYLDGFLSFTPQELAIVEQMMALHIPMVAAVTCDLAWEEVFVTGCRTVHTLKRMAERNGLSVEQQDLGESRIMRPKDLAHTEQQALLPLREPIESAGDSVFLHEAGTPFDECEHAAAEIRRLVREEKARYRDFVVTARQMDGYIAPLAMAMARYEIPVYLAEKQDLLSRPPVTLLTTALDAVRSGFRYEDVFACLKTGLTELSADEIDLLENYALIWNIRGGQWEQEWCEHPDGYGLPIDDVVKEKLSMLNSVRSKAIKPFLALRERLRGESPAGECVQALYDFLCEVHAPEQMKMRAERHEQAGRMQLAEEYRQMWEVIVSALEQFAWVCGEMPMTIERFSGLLRLVLSEYEIGTIPVSVDRVTCGDIDRACGQNAKYVFLLGANDGLIPLAGAGSSLFTDQDRQLLEGVGVEGKAYGAERLLMEQETLYRAIACPTERLYLSYHLTDADGKETRPSYFVAQMQHLLRGLPMTNGRQNAGSDALEATLPAVELACAYLAGERTPEAEAAYAYYKADARVRRAMQQNRARGPVADRKVMEELFGKSVAVTASRVDLFYSCRFAFFLRYGLRAKPRRPAQFAAPEAGTFLHYVMEHALQALGQTEGGAAAATEKQIRSACRAAVNAYISEELHGLAQRTARFRYLFSRLVHSAEEILQNVVEELQVSDFAPIDYELDFSRGGDLPPVTCTQDDLTVSLSGKVDRVDGYIQNGTLYLRVMDYKSGKKAFALSDVWYGLNMQMIIYLYALEQEGLARYREKLERELSEIVPAGILYVPAREELSSAARDTDSETLREMRDKALRRSGLLSDNMELLDAMERGLNGEGQFIPVTIKVPKKEDEAPEIAAKSAVANLQQFGKLARYTQKKLLEMGQQLRAGSVEADPCRKAKNQCACDWCDFRAACRFDKSAGDRERWLRHLSDEDVWKQMMGGEADGTTVDSAATAGD